MDAIGWFIATMHQLLGHDKAAAIIGVSPGDKADCAICRYERTMDQDDRLAVLAALAPGGKTAATVAVPGKEV